MVLVALKGIITRVYGRGPFAYMLHDGMRSSEFESPEFFQPGESVSVACVRSERSGKTILLAEKMEKVGDLYAEVEQKIMASSALRSPERFDGNIEKMKEDFEKFARKIRAAQQLGRFITVKFHGDADGISSALIVKKFLRATYAQQNSAIYSVRDAIKDAEKTTQQFKPLLVLLDFGSGEDSAQGISLAKAAGIEIISIDHHPPNPSSVSSIAFRINPWDTGCEDGSKYPAGFLCAVLARMLGMETMALENIACAGDRSTIIPLSQQDRDRALVLDFVATYSGFGHGLDFYSEVLAKHELFSSILSQANAKLEEADRLLKNALKTKSAPRAEICWFNFDSIAEKKEFPNKGKITGRVLEITGRTGPMLVIGYSKKTIVLRANDSAVANEIKANAIVEEMKTRLSGFVENGGGHARAAALRVKGSFETAVVEEIIKLIEKA